MFLCLFKLIIIKKIYTWIYSGYVSNIRLFIICIIVIQLIFFIYYINKCGIDNKDINSISNTVKIVDKDDVNNIEERHNYVKLENYRGHLNTDPNFIDFGEINEYSLCGIILKIAWIDDNNSDFDNYYKMRIII